jgi:RHS repeat-associated protein
MRNRIKLTTLTIGFIFTILVAVSSLAQSVQTNLTKYTTPPSIALDPASGNPQIGDFGSISSYNGRLNYVIPLLNIDGRGDADYTISIDLNRLWTLDYNYDDYEEGGNAIYTRSTTPNSTPWWVTSLRYMPGRLVQRTKLSLTPCLNVAEDRHYEVSLTLISQDGSEISLFPENHPGGLLLQCATIGSPGYSNQINQVSLGTEFKTVDGSGIKFVSDQQMLAPGGVNETGILYFPNGSKYRIDNSYVSWIEDRNGNKTSFVYEINQYTQKRDKLLQIIDSNGRTTDISYGLQDGQYGLHDKITYAGLGGNSQTVRITYGQLANSLRSGETLKNQFELFGIGCPPGVNSCGLETPFNPTVVTSVIFPGNRSFQYKYNSYGELARVDAPQGAAFEYDWGGSQEGGDEKGLIPDPTNGPFPDFFRQVLEKRIYSNGGSGGTYDFRTSINKSSPFPGYNPYPNLISTRTITSYGRNNTLIGVTKQTFWGHPLEPAPKPDQAPPNGTTMYPNLTTGKSKETQSYGSDGVTLASRNLKQWSFETDIANARVTKEITIAPEGNNATITLQETEYDGNGGLDYFITLNPKRIKSYNYKVLNLASAATADFQSIIQMFGANDVIALTENDYNYGQSYRDRNIVGLVSERRVLNPTNPAQVLTRTQTFYDETAYPIINSGAVNGWADPNTTIRGNQTTSRVWDGGTNTWVQSHSQFDNFGNVRRVWDTSGDQTRFVETEYDSAYNFAYATKVKTPAADPSGVHGTAVGSEINGVYDFNTGLLLSITDANGQTSTTEYDNLLRPVRRNPPAGGSMSELIYYDQDNNNLRTVSRQQIDANNWAESTVYYDRLGRAYKTRARDVQGDVVTETKFDNLGRVMAISNPYRVNTAGQPVETIYWSKPRYDVLHRGIESYAPAAVDPNNPNQHGASNGTLQFGISTDPNLIGSYTVSTDPSGRKSRAISGIYGLMRVDEATGIGGTIEQDLGPLNAPNQATFYSYNIKGEMVKVTQGQQNRYFMYDSLSRLVRVRQPEQTPNPNLATTGNPENNQWTVGYTYDVLGNVITATDAKNITITNYYDKASRPIRRTYSDGITPEVNYFYDGKGLPNVPAFSRGELTKVSSAASEDRFISFDNHGRLLASQQLTTDGQRNGTEQPFNFTYSYNLSGGLIEQTYPSGRVVRNVLDADGGLNSVLSKPANGQFATFASDFDYSATGDVRKMRLGNGLWETTQVNEQFQLTQVGLGTTATNANLLKIDYEYGELNIDGTTVDSSKNIGMIAKTTTTTPGTTFAQTFKYDAINRLREAREFNPTAPTINNWIQSFDYDRYGNRTQFAQTVENTTLATNVITKPVIDQANNRFTTGQGYIYDYNGNLVQDAEGRTFTFDGNDKQIEVRGANNQIVGQYFYDASGARVKKVTNLETTIFVYDAGGTLAAEYSVTSATPSATPTTNYLTTDHLGSPRIITNQNGNVLSRRDFMPFGEEIGVDTVQTSNRSNNPQYATGDKIRQKYTGYQKDEETNLDFAEARMYQNKHGRFTAVDPLLASSSPINPQSFNRYAYTGNNPINAIDPSGLTTCMLKSSGAVRVTNGNCNDNEERVNGQTREVTGGSARATNGIATVGDHVRINDDDSVTIVSVRRQSGDSVTIGGGGSGAGTSSIKPEEAQVNTNVTTRPLIPIPCEPSCSSTRPFPRLDTSNNPPLKTIAAIEGILTGMQFIPALNVPATVLKTVIDIGQGDFGDAAGNAVDLIPLAKFRKGGKLIDAANDFRRSGPCPLCFVAGTLVQTEEGLKPIEKIEIGDKVLSYNEETKQNEYQVILDTFKRFADDIYSIKIEGEKRALEVTSEHPFYIKVHQARSDLSSEDDDGEWEEVQDLEVGDEIRLASGSWAKILDIKFKGKGQVFNFSVAGNHNYFVGNSRLLTHNTNNCFPRGDFEFTNDVSLNNVKKIAQEGIQNPIEFIEYEGRKYVVDGNHRLASAYKSKTFNVPAKQTTLPTRGFKSVEELVDAASPTLRQRIMRKLSY